VKHICATFLVLCNTTIADLDSEKIKFIDEVKSCALHYNSLINIQERLPIYLVIAQGAFESDWGRSRFAVEGNNLFGVRAVSESEPHLHAQENEKVMVKTYLTKCDSVQDYMELLMTGKHYKRFQEEIINQWLLDEIDIDKLIDTLDNYAENPNYKTKLKETVNYLTHYIK